MNEAHDFQSRFSLRLSARDGRTPYTSLQIWAEEASAPPEGKAEGEEKGGSMHIQVGCPNLL